MEKYVPIEKCEELVLKAKAKGQDKAWELAKKLVSNPEKGGFSIYELQEIFGNWFVSNILQENSFDEAIEKIKFWEESKKPKVGDEYKANGGSIKLVITNNRLKNGNVYSIFDDGSCGEQKLSDLEKYYTKTGRKLPIYDWLNQIREIEKENE